MSYRTDVIFILFPRYKRIVCDPNSFLSFNHLQRFLVLTCKPMPLVSQLWPLQARASLDTTPPSFPAQVGTGEQLAQLLLVREKSIPLGFQFLLTPCI